MDNKILSTIYIGCDIKTSKCKVHWLSTIYNKTYSIVAEIPDFKKISDNIRDAEKKLTEIMKDSKLIIEILPD